MENPNQITTAVLLAAGKGTRMKHLTAERPKPLVPVAGRPILEWLLVRLRDAGIQRFVIVTGYLGRQIEAAFGDGARLGIETVFVRQVEQSGTATALLLCREHVPSAPFVLSWGDILVEPRNYARLLAAFGERPCDLLLTVNRVDDPYRGAAVYLRDDGTVERIVEKPPQGASTTNWNNAGVFVLTPLVFDYAARLKPSPRGEYELPEAMRSMIEDGRRVRALPIEGYWSDVGTPEDVERMSERLRQGG